MEQLHTLTSLIVFAPLIGAGIAGFLGKIIGRTLTHTLTTTLVGLSCILSNWLFYNVLNGENIHLNSSLYTWAMSGSIVFNLGFMLDNLTVIMLSVVTAISLVVHIYTIAYMREDPGYQRFFSYISAFTFAMLMLVTANNFLQLFFGWEAVGLMSYLLIGFWYKKEAAIFASFKAFIVNRVGDFGFLIGIAAMLSACSSLDYVTVFAAVPKLQSVDILLMHTPINLLTFICICLFIGAMGKSAQVPLHVWLPDSMEGPTPISALIHAATMVTAGVFMVVRMAPLFEHSVIALNIVLLLGAITSLSMGILAIVQKDIKRIIAYSTLSQLGYMVTALGSSAYAAAIFHLMTHAFYKALLFLGAGSVILSLQHEQNVQQMGGLKKHMPITFYTMLIGSLALIGFPGFSGFFSKDLIIESVRLSTLPAAQFAYFAVVAGVFVTGLYSSRLMFLVFFGKEKFKQHTMGRVRELGCFILIPLLILAIPSVLSGWWLVDKLARFFPEHNMVLMPEEHFFTITNAMLCLGLSVGWLGYIKWPALPRLLQQKLHVIDRILIAKYGFDFLYINILAPGVRLLGQLFWKMADLALIDGILVHGTVKYIGRIAGIVRKLQTGYIYHYAFFMLVGFFILFGWLVFR